MIPFRHKWDDSTGAWMEQLFLDKKSHDEEELINAKNQPEAQDEEEQCDQIGRFIGLLATF